MNAQPSTLLDLLVDEPAAGLSPEAERIVRQAGGRVHEHRVDAGVRLPLWTAQRGTSRHLRLSPDTSANVYIPPGSREDREVEVLHAGARYYVRVTLMPEPGITVRGGDLHCQVVVPDETCVLGGFAYARTGPGYPTKFTVQRGTRDGTLYRLPGLGLPDPWDADSCGDFCVLVRKESRFGTVRAPSIPHAPPTPTRRPAAAQQASGGRFRGLANSVRRFVNSRVGRL